MGLPKFLLHGLWLPDSGLQVWVEQVAGHKIITLDEVPKGTFPKPVHTLLEGVKFRHRGKVMLRTPKGKLLRLRVPTAAFAPDEAVQFLRAMSFLLDPDVPAPEGLTEQQRASVAPDLLWLIQMFLGLERFVQAGRVSIHVPSQDFQWFAQWQLGTGVEERGWLADMIAAAPGVLTENNRRLDEDCSRTFVHWIASAQLRNSPMLRGERPFPWHDFVQSLLNGTPLRRGSSAFSRQMSQWNGSITATNFQLVFIVEQPADAEDGGDEALTQWPIRVNVRSGDESPRPIRLSEYDAYTVQQLHSVLRDAIRVSDLIDPSTHRRAATTPGSALDGDWDVYLSAEEIVQFVETEVSKLRLANYAVMLPRAWTTAETTSKLHLSEAKNPYDATAVTRLGFGQLVNYDWRVSIGGTELTDDEMQRLVESKSGLIKLRGEWVLADTRHLERTKRYMEKLHGTALARAKREAEEARTTAQLAADAGADDAEALAARADQLEEEYQKLEASEEHGAVTAEELRQLALESGPDSPLEFTGSRWFTSLVGGMDRPAPERVDIPRTVHAELREYQRRGVDWLYYMSRNHLGAVLADDMGLGKTLQLLTLLAVEEERGQRTGPTLVVAPTSVVGNWAREAAKFVPHLSIYVHHGSARYKGEELREALKKHDITITSYGIASRDVIDLSLIEWDHVVLDEAQAIKNAGTRASKSVRALPARHRIALTGTPIENKLSELRSLLDFVNPGILGSQSFFRNHFARAIESRRDEGLADEMGERLQRLTAPFILRRLKTDTAIIDDLPDKAEHVLTVDMTAEQAALYTALVDRMQRELQERKGMARKGLVLATITRIKQICNHPAHFLGDGSPVLADGHHRSGKVARLVELLNEAVRTDQRVLIFTQYKAFGDILRPYLSDYLGELIPFLHGGVGKSARDAMVARFQEPNGPRAMLLSLKAGGTGLNLTAASMVIHLDRWWNPAVENQATDRAFRIGQKKDVTVYKMITRGTMEESIQDILDGKMHLAGAVIGEGEGWITELDADDLAQLMSYRGNGGERNL